MAKPKYKLGTINISDEKNERVTVDIEGIIGIPEWWQFDSKDDRVATYNKFQNKIKELKAIEAKYLDINIKSPGGSVNDALLIHSTICTLENVSVTTICYGFTASAATLIAQAGKKRKICSNSLYLAHRALNVALGNVNEFREKLTDLEKIDTTIAKLYADRSGNSIDIYQELMNRNNGNGEWLTPQEVIDLKLADEILQLTSSVNMDTEELLSEFRYPKIPDNIFPAAPSGKDYENLFNRFINYFNSSNINSNNNITMKKEWKTVNQILNVEGLEVKNGVVTLSEAQMQNIEDKLSEGASDTEKEKTTVVDEKKPDDEPKVSEKDKEIQALKIQIENLQKGAGDTTKDVSKETDATNAENDDFTNTVKNAKELYKILSN